MREDFFLCPGCGREVRVGALRCFHCQPRKSWEQDTRLDGLDLPDDDEDWDYEDFLVRESGGNRGTRVRGLWVGVAVVLVLVLAWLSFGGGIF